MDDHVLMKLDFLQMVGGTRYPIPHNYTNGAPADGYTVIFQCFGGKILIGPTSSTCQDGTWSHLPQSCESKESSLLLKCIHHGQIWLVSTIESIVKLNNQHIILQFFSLYQ